MKSKAELQSELTVLQELLDIIVYKRRKKIIVRLILDAIFSVCFWHLAWVRYLFWIGLPLEIILLVFTLLSYFRLRTKIRAIQVELE